MTLEGLAFLVGVVVFLLVVFFLPALAYGWVSRNLFGRDPKDWELFVAYGIGIFVVTFALIRLV